MQTVRTTKAEQETGIYEIMSEKDKWTAKDMLEFAGAIAGLLLIVMISALMTLWK